jgi:uncharacterized protein (TIGR00730 family)
MTMNVCVYCGASGSVDQVYKDAAAELGTTIGENGYGLVYGGGRLGLMGIVADHVIKAGGKATGFIPEHLDEREGAHSGLNELHIVDNMHTRKMRMSDMADVFVIAPGGYGTLDEFFEILTWRQLNLHQKPIVILNINNYWGSLIKLLHSVIDQGFAKQEHRQYVTVLDRVDLVADVVKRAELAIQK